MTHAGSGNSESPASPQGEPRSPATTGATAVPPLVDWVSRHSGWLLFVTILLAALLEGVGIYYGKRRAADSAARRERSTQEAPPASGAGEQVDLRRLERQP